MQKTLHSSDYQRFLKLLRAARQKAGLTQVEAAVRMRATQTFVSKCERGERRLDLVEVRQWCAALGVSFKSLIAEFDRPPPRSRKRSF